MSNPTPTGPKSAVSVIVFLFALSSTVFLKMVMLPYLVKRQMFSDYPNSLLFWVALSGVVANVGFIIGGLYNYNPALYQESDPLINTQWVFLGSGGGTGLLVIFFYILGLYQIVCEGKKGKNLIGRARYIVGGSFILSVLVLQVLPLAFPHTYTDVPEGDPRENKTVVFAPQGPWAGASADLRIHTGLFYGLVIPPCLVSLYLGFNIIWKVYVTTKETQTTFAGSNSGSSNGATSPTHKKSHRAKKARLMRFYGRISIFVVVYSVATIIGMITRIMQVLDDDYDVNENDPTMGTSLALPLLVLIQSLVLLSTPAISRFYSKELFLIIKGKEDKHTTTTTSNEKEYSAQPSALMSRAGSQFGSTLGADKMDQTEGGGKAGNGSDTALVTPSSP